MYEELVHSLRICGDSADPIAECCYEDCIQHEYPIDTQCMRALCHKAADAIEKLSKVDTKANSIIDGLQNLLASVKERPRWIPVTERLPEAKPGGVSERVLVTDGKDVSIVEWFNFEECGSFWGYTGFGEDVTHWMPLPQPPKED